MSGKPANSDREARSDQQRQERSKAVINKLKQDNESLKQRLARESRFSRLSQNLSTSKDIMLLQEEANSYLKRIEVERKKISELDAEINKFNGIIIEQRRKMGGINASKDNHEMISRQIRLYENRLDKALMKFNAELAKNKVLRDKIDNLRAERVVFDGIYKKLERELHEKKKEMQAIIEDSYLAYQARDKSQNEMLALKAQAEADQRAFETEWEELGKLMEEDRKLRQPARTMIKSPQAAPAANSPASKTEAPEAMGGIPPIKGDAGPQLSIDKVMSYEQAYEKIKEATGVSDIHELIDMFLTAEDANFRKFNFVNTLNSEIENMEQQISDTKSNIEKYKGQGVTTDTQRKKQLRNLEDQLRMTLNKTDEYEKKYQQATKTINQLKQGIHSLFTRLGCNSSSVEEMLGNQGVTESNMMQYLGIIEQKTSEILQTYAASQANVMQKTGGELGIIQHPAPRLQVMPPAWEDFDSDDDESEPEDNERPLTREELQRKTLRGMGKKEVKQRPTGRTGKK